MTGSGSIADPFVIWDVFDLQNMNLDLTAYYELGQDIDASATVGWNGGLGFDPVGDSINRFTGSFDGNGYKVSDLVIHRTRHAAPTTVFPDYNDVGLFGGLGDGAIVQNVELENVAIDAYGFVGSLAGYIHTGTITVLNCSSSGYVHGEHHKIGGLVGCAFTGASQINCHSSAVITSDGMEVGGLIGQNFGSVTDCYATGAVTIADAKGGGLIGDDYNSNITRCYATGDVEIGLTHHRAGGLIGASDGSTISQCFATGNATSGRDYVGGLIGDSDSTITDCYARGNVDGRDIIGGFIGLNDGDIDNCYSTGLVTGTDVQLGGLVAINGGTVINSFWDTETSGLLVSNGGTGRTTAEMKTPATFIDAGWSFGVIWGMTPPCSNGYPCLLNITSGCLWITAPTVSTNPATNVEGATATLNGTLNDDGGEACECGFEWGETPALGNTTPTQSGTTGTTFSFNLSGLTPGKTYYFRAFATNSAGTGYGAILSFTLKVGATVMTLPATHITEHAARLHGVVIDDAGRMGEVRFQWGLTAQYGANTPWIGGHITGDEFEYDLPSLAEGTGYHFRAQFRNLAIVSGKDMVFHTLVPLGPVTLIPEDLVHLLEASV